MNEHLASENAALIAELAKLQRRQRQQEEEEGRQRQGPSLVAGIPAHKLESLLSLPRTSPAAAVAVPCSSSASSGPADAPEAHAEAPDADQAQKKSVEKKSVAKREKLPEAWDASQSALLQRAQTLETQVELTRLRAEGKILRAEAAEALTEAQTKQGVINMLQQQLSAAHGQHGKEVKELKRAAKLTERRTEELTQQLPMTNGDSSFQVSWLSMSMLTPERCMSGMNYNCAYRASLLCMLAQPQLLLFLIVCDEMSADICTTQQQAQCLLLNNLIDAAGLAARSGSSHACVAQVQAIRDDHAKQRHAWASARRTLQAQQSSLQDECNDLACQLAERDQQLRAQDERISYLKKLLKEANLAVTSRRNSEVYTHRVFKSCLPADARPSAFLPSSLQPSLHPFRYIHHCISKYITSSRTKHIQS